jgi:hypothetical protein
VHGAAEEVATYLKNIQLLWKLGRRPALEHLQDQRGKRFDPPPEPQSYEQGEGFAGRKRRGHTLLTGTTTI